MADSSTANKAFEAAQRALDEKLESAHRVTLGDVRFSQGAMYTIGLAVKEIAEKCGLFTGELTKRLQGHMYWLEGSESLMILFPVPEIQAEMMVEIPQGHWWFKDADERTQ